MMRQINPTDKYNWQTVQASNPCGNHRFGKNIKIIKRNQFHSTKYSFPKRKILSVPLQSFQMSWNMTYVPIPVPVPMKRRINVLIIFPYRTSKRRVSQDDLFTYANFFGFFSLLCLFNELVLSLFVSYHNEAAQWQLNLIHILFFFLFIEELLKRL